ncbi:hypothetical protein ACEQ8H_001358 [Pleosporales sp. CAS-2024a]
MAQPAENSHSAVVVRLSHLLQRARQVKPSSAIDPPLQVSDLVPEEESLLGDLEGDDEARKLAVETAAKTLFYANLINSKNKDLVILRLCNELLRRLSRAEDPVFCGRVYIFMFQSFPLGDKSSVNLRGNFHVENVTTFEEFLNETSANEGQMQVDDVKDISAEKGDRQSEERSIELKGTDARKDEEPSTMDIDSLYPVFWSLQHSFSNPPRLFEQDHFTHFQKSLEATLAKFKEVPKVIQAGDSERRRGHNEQDSDDQDTFTNAYNPKYLTSRDLFKLELGDLAFQRHILVQALILLDFLLALTEKAKSKSIYQKAQKAMQYNFTLREEDTEWASGIKTAIANYLQEGPDGKFYYRMVDTVLSRDKNWVRWKMENCQPFTRDRVATKDYIRAKSEALQAVSRRWNQKPRGVPRSLKFLYNNEAETGLGQLRSAKRYVVPRLHDDAKQVLIFGSTQMPTAEWYAKKVQLADLDMDFAESEEEKRVLTSKKSSYVWKGLRLASKKQLSSFDRMEHGKGLEALQPAAEAAGDGPGVTIPDDRGAGPHDEAEELRPGHEQSQVMADSAA